MADNYDQYGSNSGNTQNSQGGQNQDPYGQGNYYQDHTGNGQYQYQGQNPNGQRDPRDGKANALSIIGLILAIISIPACCCSLYNFVIVIPALVCSIIGYRQTKSGVALAGIICAAIGMVLTTIMLVFYFIGLSIFGNISPSEMNSILESLEGYY